MSCSRGPLLWCYDRCPTFVLPVGSSSRSSQPKPSPRVNMERCTDFHAGRCCVADPNLARSLSSRELGLLARRRAHLPLYVRGDAGPSKPCAACRSYGIASYYVQKLFAELQGVRYLATAVQTEEIQQRTAASATCDDADCDKIALKVRRRGPGPRPTSTLAPFREVEQATPAAAIFTTFRRPGFSSPSLF